MTKLIPLLIFLLMVPCANAAPPTRSFSYVTGTTISSSEVTTNEDNIYNYLQGGVDTIKDGIIVDGDVNSAAGIVASKLNLTSVAQDMNITSGGSLDVDGAAQFDGTATMSGTTTVIKTLESPSVDINGGNIDGTTIGAASTAAGTFSSLTATTADINGGTVDGATVGASSATTGKFTTVTQNSAHLTETTAPTTAASEGAVYTKDTSGQPELFYREESDGDEVQMTSGGKVKGGGFEFVSDTSLSGTNSGNIAITQGTVYKVVFKFENEAGTEPAITLRFQSDGGNNYANSGGAPGSPGDSSITLFSTAMEANDGVGFGEFIMTPINTDMMYVYGNTMHENSGTGNLGSNEIVGFWDNSATVTDFEFVSTQTVTFKVLLYKLNES